MKKYVIIDCRMRQIEKEFFKNLGYNIIEIQKSEKVYQEISSHVDIFACQIDDVIIVEKTQYKNIKNQIGNFNMRIIQGESEVREKISGRYKIQCLSNWQNCVA